MSLLPKPHVIKLGGSLLERDDWPGRWNEWLKTQPHAPTLVLVGGGEAVECLRREARRHAYPDAAMHHAALHCMQAQALLVAARLTPGNPLLGSPDEFTYEYRVPRFVAIVDWWRVAVQRGVPLPAESWDVTSDTLALWCAGLIQAKQVTLLKSRLPLTTEVADWARDGYVDQAFPDWRTQVAEITAIDLTSCGFPLQRAKKSP